MTTFEVWFNCLTMRITNPWGNITRLRALSLRQGVKEKGYGACQCDMEVNEFVLKPHLI